MIYLILIGGLTAAPLSVLGRTPRIRDGARLIALSALLVALVQWGAW